MILSTNFSAIRRTVFIFILCFTAGCQSITISIQEKPEGSVSTNKLRPVIALLPIQNISGTKAPLVEIRQTIKNSLNAEGFSFVDAASFSEFIKKHRIRYTGGVDSKTAKYFKEETGAEAVFQTSLELYRDAQVPQISLTARLIGTDNNRILWMGSISISGNDAPGLLDLSLIKDSRILMQKAVERLVGDLTEWANGKRNTQFLNGQNFEKIQSGNQYKSPGRFSRKVYRVAVIPFYNSSERKYAGEIMALHFLKHLLPCEHILFVEPGEVRKVFLGWRIIMDDGISLVDADVLFQKLDADYILTGNALDYEDAKGAFGKSKVHFSVCLLEKETKKVIWGTNSYSEGDDSVFMFGMGEIYTAHTLAAKMTEQAAETLIPFFIRW